MPHASDVVYAHQQTSTSTLSSPGWNLTGAPPPPDPLEAPVPPAPTGAPAPGSLGIRERRSWATWQLVSVAIVAFLGGMLIEFLAAGSGALAGGKANAKSYTPPPPSSSSSIGNTSSGGVTPTSTTPTTAPVSTGQTTPTTAPVTAPAQVLLGPYQSQGNWTSTPFTIAGGTWNIGWAFRCTPAPASGPAFQVFVVPAGASPTGAAAVSQSGVSGQSITPETTPGGQQLQVQAPPGCVWVVKVTGVG